ncbi:MAG TPA: transporter substrate-binding domain-containing protein, partial [Thermodesulfobacteriaceae bacterium]|nr:transporter substrate-binding domain-containing protein [Thermodesulfobacteriaceae bacterium]
MATLTAVVIAGCTTAAGNGKASTQPTEKPVAVQADETETAEKLPQNVLRVGISPDYPPMIFKQGKKLAGLEFEPASILARELDRLVKFVELRWDQQIPAL